MKKYTIFAVVLVLTISMLTGCGCTRRGNEMVTTPTVGETILPTIPATAAPTVPETVMPTIDTTEGTRIPDGTNGTDSTAGTDTATNPAARHRNAPMN